jgi:hypothetical protein
MIAGEATRNACVHRCAAGDLSDDGQPAPYPSLIVRACNGRVADHSGTASLGTLLFLLRLRLTGWRHDPFGPHVDH